MNDEAWTIDMGDCWQEACIEAHKIAGPAVANVTFVWYSADINQSLRGEYEQCVKDAKQGNERAQIYLGAFMKQRMLK